jgi:MFS family permease
VVRFTVAEPERGHHDAPALRGQQAPRLGLALRELAGRRSFCWIALASSCQAFGLYGIGAWLPSYLIRGFGLGTAEVGSWLALIVGGVGALGTLAGGWVGDRLGKRDPRWYVWLPLAGGLVGLPFTVAMFAVDDAYAVLALNVIPVFVNFVYMAPVLVAVQLLVGPRMRAMSSAVLFFVINLIGMGGGPLFIGVLSDQLAPRFGEDSLRAAMAATVLLATVLGGICYLRAARTLAAELGLQQSR